LGGGSFDDTAVGCIVRGLLLQTHLSLCPLVTTRVARFPPTRFLSISSSMLTRQGPPTPTVYWTYIIKHRGPKSVLFDKNWRILIECSLHKMICVRHILRHGVDSSHRACKLILAYLYQPIVKYGRFDLPGGFLPGGERPGLKYGISRKIWQP